jgi:hypothetical protein
MPITFPQDASAGGQATARRAQQIYEHIVWIARWSNEIVLDAAVDMKKLGQLAYGPQSHSGRFLALTANGGGELMAAVQARFQAEGTTITQAQLTGLRTQVQSLVDAVGTPAEWPLSTRVWTIANGEVERPAVEPKPHPLMPAVQAVRNEFT